MCAQNKLLLKKNVLKSYFWGAYFLFTQHEREDTSTGRLLTGNILVFTYFSLFACTSLEIFLNFSSSLLCVF